jgi:PAS domain S-box-containing protein
MFVTDLEGKLRRVNRAGLRLLGVEAGTLAGMHINKVLKCELYPEKPADREVAFDDTISYRREDGELLTLRAALTAMTGDNEQQQGYIVNVQDVTLLKKLEEQAARRDRFTAMGEMAANIAHEIRNPLGSIELFASLAKKGMPPEDEKLEYINHITNGVASMNHIISNLLEYTKPRPVSLQKVDLHKLVKETVEFTRFSASQNQVEMGLALKARQSRINGDPELLKQVFHNLILNAVQAMPDGGALQIASRQRKLTNPALLSRMSGTEGMRQREVVELSFKDKGAGMPEEIRKQIFDPFFTTKARGTGLGLAIVHNIMESHRAVIDVESAARQGTAFVLMFPTV